MRWRVTVGNLDVRTCHSTSVGTLHNAALHHTTGDADFKCPYFARLEDCDRRNVRLRYVLSNDDLIGFVGQDVENRVVVPIEPGYIATRLRRSERAYFGFHRCGAHSNN